MNDLARRPRIGERASQMNLRLWVRRASVIIVLSQALGLLIASLSWTTPMADRFGLLLGAGLVTTLSGLWFLLVPRGLFGAWREFVASAIAQLTLLVTFELTGGLSSIYFPYFVLPFLVMVTAGDRWRTIALGATGAAGMVGFAVVGHWPLEDAARDLLVARLLQLVVLTMAAGAASRAMGAIRMALAAQTRDFADQARTDPLTGLGNRMALVEESARLMSAADRQRAPLSLVAFDLDGLKVVNDRDGHAAGDRLICRFADVLRLSLRGQDLPVRAGGDEFLVVLPGTSAAGAGRLIERIREAAADSDPVVAFSAGSATSSTGSTIAGLLALADAALYADKASRRRSASPGPR